MQSTTVNYIRHLNSFFASRRKDDRLHSNDISLYLTLFHFWNINHFQSPFSIFRDDVMLMSGIGSRETYMQCMKWLDHCGYIQYIKPTKKFELSKIRMFLLTEPGNGPQQEPENGSPPGPESGTSVEPDSGLQSGPLTDHLNKQLNKFKTKREKKPSLTKIPELEDVRAYFKTVGLAETEASKFFYHYQANGWMMGKSPVKNWQAAVEKWKTNIIQFKNTKPGNLHVDENKQYDDPF